MSYDSKFMLSLEILNQSTWNFTDVDGEFTGNTNVDTKVMNLFSVPVKATNIRIYPTEKNNHFSSIFIL